MIHNYIYIYTYINIYIYNIIYIFYYVYIYICGNLILNWPKLLRPFEGPLKPFFHVISMCMCSQCDSTSLPVQRSQI